MRVVSTVQGNEGAVAYILNNKKNFCRWILYEELFQHNQTRLIFLFGIALAISMSYRKSFV